MSTARSEELRALAQRVADALPAVEVVLTRRWPAEAAELLR